MKLTRGLHSKTLPQREGRPGHWAVLPPTADQVEYRDAPMRAVTLALVGTMLGLLLIIGGVLVFVGAIKPRTPLSAETAEAHFHPAGPPLLDDPRA